jgi:hypothetical protein
MACLLPTLFKRRQSAANGMSFQAEGREISHRRRAGAIVFGPASFFLCATTPFIKLFGHIAAQIAVQASTMDPHYDVTSSLMDSWRP